MTYKKKLIEVAIPLEAINAASAREKSIRHGHPSTLHLWWARRPLAACRAVLFAQLVDDPSSHPDKFPTEEAVEAERKRLFQIIEDLVKWENSTNEEVLERARAEIRSSCGGELPPVYDPFSGGGSIPLEAQRLGLPAYGSDLNPVAVMIGKAMIEIPPKFKDMEPIHPGGKERNHYRNAEGLAEDVKYYGEWMREKAWERIGHLYPQVDLPSEYGGGKATVIAWIWARTVPSPDPAFSDVHVPLASTFLLSSRDGDEAWIEPEIDRSAKTISFKIRRGGTKAEIEAAAKGSKMSRGANFRCLISDAAISPEYVKSASKKGDLGKILIAVIANLPRGKAYLAPSEGQINADKKAAVETVPSLILPRHPQYNGVSGYGMETFGDIFTRRQLAVLENFCDLIGGVAQRVEADFSDKTKHGSRASTKTSAQEYGRAVATYLAFAIDKVADRNSSLVNWAHNRQHASNTFKRQALPMTWDFSEINPFSSSSGNFEGGVRSIYLALEQLFFPASGEVEQLDAQSGNFSGKVVSTDPPYYDNVPYADISDFFYVWMKRSLASFYPDLFDTVAVPKGEELVADRVRHQGKQRADDFFLKGMSAAFSKARHEATDIAPMAIYYAFKQSEISQDGVSSAGWVSFLEAVLMSGFSIVGTWPVRTELARRVRGLGSNALANSVVLVCRKKEETAETITRAEFIRTLKRELPPAITELQAANVSPADMPQSAIGPGMGVFSRYKAVLEADDSPMTVKTALQLINAELDEYLNDLHGDFDPDTRRARP